MTAFFRSAHALESRTSRPGLIALAVAGVFAIAWTWWFFSASVAIYAVSAAARVEVERAPSPVQSPVAGRVVATHLTLGNDVRSGDVLVELDTQAQTLEANEQRAQVGAVAPQLERLEAEIRSEESAAAAERGANDVAIAEARQKFAEASAAADLAQEEATRTEKLHAGKLVSDVELLRAQAEVKRRRAAAETLRLSIDRLAITQRQAASTHDIQIQRLQREAAALRGRSATGAATIERLQNEGALRRIVAPANGKLAEVAELRVGAYMREGERVATIVPSGALHVVALFTPGDALGRVQRGQSARIRLEGFPWATHGSVTGTVAAVAEEVRDGRVRVELAVNRVPPTIRLEHGLPGSVEVDVEHLSPAALVLRAAGARLAATRKDSTSAALSP